MLKGYKESLEKAIPDTWEIGILSDVSEIKFSNVDKITSSEEAPILLCNYLDVYNNEYINDRIEFMPATATDKEIEKFALKKGDVIITKDSETPDDIAKPAVVVQDLTNVLCGYHLALIRPDSQRVDSVFLGKMLSSKIVNRQFERLAQGLTRFGLEVSSIKNALITIPPQQEQRKIAEILSTVDEVIEKTDAIIQETQQLKRGLMQKLFTEGIGHTKFKETKIGLIPEEWEVTRIGGVTEIRGGSTPLTARQDYWENGDILWATPTDITSLGSKYISDTSRRITQKAVDETSLRLCEPGAVLMTSRATIGYPAIAERPITTNQGFINIHCNELIEVMFLYYWIIQSRRLLQRLAQGSTFLELSKKDFRRLLIALPPLPEQHYIAQILSEVDAKIEAEQASMAELEQLKKGLMQVLLTGEVRVKV